MKATSLPLAALAATALALAAPGHAHAAKSKPSKSGKPASGYIKPVVPFLENDYTRALAQARARRVPLFIEAWAPW